MRFFECPASDDHGPFSKGGNCGTTLEPGRSCTFTIGWSEVNGGDKLSVFDDDAGSPQIDLSPYSDKGSARLSVLAIWVLRRPMQIVEENDGE